MSSSAGGEGDDDEDESQFDRLPDPLLLAIFNQLQDVRSLGRSSAVCRRFRSLVPLTESVLVRVDCVVSTTTSPSSSAPDADRSSGGILGSIAKLLLSSFLLRPIFYALHEILLPKKVLLTAEVSHHSPSEVLCGFREIRSLKIVLPSGELGMDPGAVLKWNAEFGRSLESCAILGATSFRKVPALAAADASGEIGGNCDAAAAEDPAFCTNGGLKLRVVWTITSLIAASARHFLLRNIVCEHPMLTSLQITDADGQGILRMGKEQLGEFRQYPLEASASSNRTQVPALNMKLWYAPRLELKSGYVMDGATLVAIRPVDRQIKLDGDGFVTGAFVGPFHEAAKAMVKKKTYLLEMNPF